VPGFVCVVRIQIRKLELIRRQRCHVARQWVCRGLGRRCNQLLWNGIGVNRERIRRETRGIGCRVGTQATQRCRCRIVGGAVGRYMR
jgi:hypothetical protein